MCYESNKGSRILNLGSCKGSIIYNLVKEPLVVAVKTLVNTKTLDQKLNTIKPALKKSQLFMLVEVCQ